MKTFLKKLIPVRALYLLARGYWFFRRPTTRGAKVVIRNDSGDILFVRHTYRPANWTFPGGGIKRGERPTDTVIREVKEETGLDLFSVLYAGEFTVNQDFKNDTIMVYNASANDRNITVDALEIAEARWFPAAQIPKLPPNAQRIFDTANLFMRTQT